MTSDDQRPPDTDAYPEGDDAVSELESAEQYVRAHEVIESLRADRRPPREPGSEEDARLSATAALLHAASPDGGRVDPLFAARLFARLEAEQGRQASADADPQTPAVAAQAPETAQAMTQEAQPHDAPHPAPTDAPIAPPTPQPAPLEPHAPSRRSGVSRRGVLLGGLGAAAAALAGAAVTAALEPPASEPVTQNSPSGPLVPEGTGAWVAVALLDSMPRGAVKRFEAGAVIGYLQHTANGFLALSGVCTHMACLLQWNGADRTFDCPCHGGRFLPNGAAAPGARYSYPSLPAIKTKVEAGQVWVYVTGGAENAEFPSGQGTTTTGGYGASR